MKARFFVVGMLLLLCAACYTSTHEAWRATSQQELSAIDSLMWQRPDSALAVLLDFAASPKADSLDVFDGHYTQLLASELLYKNDYQQSNRTELRQAVAYFDSLMMDGAGTRSVSLPFLTARVHYINGVGYYERDSVVEACGEYLKALEIMESHFAEKKLVGKKARFMALINNRFGELFSTQFMSNLSIICYEQSLAFCKIEPTSLFGVSNTLLYLGKQYDKIGEKHLARSYYEQAIAALPDTNNLVYRDITAIKALCEYQLGAGIECPLTTLYQILALADTEVERLTRFLTIGRIFYEENLYDSALFYIEPVFESDYRLTSRIQAADCLRNIYQNKGDKEKMNEYARFLADHRKPESQNKALVSQLDTMFQDYLGQKQERKIVQKRKDTIRKVVWTMVFVIGLFFVGIVLMKCRNKRHLETLRRSHRMEQAALSGRLKQSNQELRELKDQIKRQGDNEIASTEVQATTFLKEPICCLVLERVNEGQFLSQMDCTIYRNYALDKNQLAALRNAADRHFNQFTMRISNAHPELTRTDLDYCCLYLLGLSDADVAALMQRAYNTVNERNSKLRRVFGSKNSISVTLQSIANESAID